VVGGVRPKAIALMSRGSTCAAGRLPRVRFIDPSGRELRPGETHTYSPERSRRIIGVWIEIWARLHREGVMDEPPPDIAKLAGYVVSFTMPLEDEASQK
jgi:hypothetical protein